MRSYSLSDLPDAGRYRITIKEEPHGIASTYLSTQLRAGDVLEVSEPRGAFILEPGDLPVVLLSAGVGVTPLMAMLHALAARASPRPVWWIYGARNRLDHPFAREARELLAKLPHAWSHVQYSQPDATNRLSVDFDVAGRLTVAVLEKLGVPRESDFYLCGPPNFLGDFTAGLGVWGVARDRVHTEIFGSGKSVTPGVKNVAEPVTARAFRVAWRRSKNLICSRRPHGRLGSRVPEPAGTHGSLRRSGTLVLPDRSLPYL